MGFRYHRLDVRKQGIIVNSKWTLRSSIPKFDAFLLHISRNPSLSETRGGAISLKMCLNILRLILFSMLTSISGSRLLELKLNGDRSRMMCLSGLSGIS
ncbi:hypothetical protein L873DRAFT_646208 [Choiromyces venosus 120613-1]|uniref:Uncharacterized protein n=1 Tax=Choiromyces venosus 120613-1 TaxID=1336337 RepID=A0A3N4K6Y6_9PEZI|nr:hypothetical protein L873DRAFT_646208 [Choiromyces venosus 120613-1]